MRHVYNVNEISSFWVLEDIDNGISSEEHLGNETTLCDCCSFFTLLWHLSPNLLNILHHHVHVTVEGFDFPKQLFVVSKSNQNFVVSLDRFSQKRKWSDVKIILLNLWFFLHLLYYYSKICQGFKVQN